MYYKYIACLISIQELEPARNVPFFLNMALRRRPGREGYEYLAGKPGRNFWMSVYRQPPHKKIARVGRNSKFFTHYSNLTYNSSGCSSKNFNVAGQSQPFDPFSQEYHAPPYSISFFSSLPCESGKFFAEKIIL